MKRDIEAEEFQKAKKVVFYTVDWAEDEPPWHQKVLSVMERNWRNGGPLPVIGNLNVTEETAPKILELSKRTDWLTVCADNPETLSDIYETIYLVLYAKRHVLSLDPEELRAAMGSGVVSVSGGGKEEIVQILTSSPYFSPDSGIVGAQNAHFTLVQARTDENFDLDKIETLMQSQSSHIADPAARFFVILGGCPFSFERVIYSSSIIHRKTIQEPVFSSASGSPPLCDRVKIPRPSGKGDGCAV